MRVNVALGCILARAFRMLIDNYDIMFHQGYKYRKYLTFPQPYSGQIEKCFGWSYNLIIHICTNISIHMR